MIQVKSDNGKGVYWQMHEQTGETQISLDIDSVWSEFLLSAWINGQADLSLLGLQAILLVWTL